MSARRTITVYPKNGEKFVVFDSVDGVVQKNDIEHNESHQILGDGENFHARILRTYHELECKGELRDMGPRQKQGIRDLHVAAQNPAYWGEKKTLGYTDGLES